MRLSTERILTTHVGSMPRPQPLVDALLMKDRGEVKDQAAYDRVIGERGIFRAEEILLAVEIKSPSTQRTDSVIKHSEYADAGIGHYWIIDLEDGPSLTACHLGGEFGYIDAEPVKGVFETDTPFPARVDLTALV